MIQTIYTKSLAVQYYLAVFQNHIAFQLPREQVELDNLNVYPIEQAIASEINNKTFLHYICPVIYLPLTFKRVSDFHLKYTTVARDCAFVNPRDADVSDGCHDNLPSYEMVRNLVEIAVGENDLGGVDFDGKVCYGKENYSYTDSAHQGSVSGVLIIIMSTLWILIH